MSHSKEQQEPSLFKQTILEPTDLSAFTNKKSTSSPKSEAKSSFNATVAYEGSSSQTADQLFISEPLFAPTIEDSIDIKHLKKPPTPLFDQTELEATQTIFEDPIIQEEIDSKDSITKPAIGRRTTILPKATMSSNLPVLQPTFKDRYETIKGIGEGAAGEILLAKDNDIQRLVALKKLKKEHNAPTEIARFVEEIQTVGQLEHPNIVPIHDVGIDENGQYYFVMKYVEGQTMADVIKKLADGDPKAHAQYTFEVRNQVFLKIIQALQFAHKHGIIHRDIKPENIMIGAFGQVMIMDWGIAKRIRSPLSGQHQLPSGISPPIKEVEKENQLPTEDQQLKTRLKKDPERLFETRVGTIIGTPAYMAPEQALGQIDLVDERSDIYSLSTLYYEWMTLQNYLAHKTTINDMLWGIIKENPTFPTYVKNQHQTPVPAEFAHFCMKGLNKDPGQRYQSLGEMIGQMQLTMAGLFEAQCPITMTKKHANRILKSIDKHPENVFGVLIGTALLSVFALFGAIQVGVWVASLL